MKLSNIEKILLFITVVIAFVVLPNKFMSRPQNSNTVTQKAVETPEVVDLGMTIEEFQAEYNKNALDRNLPQMQLKNIEFGTGDKSNTFYYKFVDTFYLFGKVNPETGKIKSLNVMKALVFSGDDGKAEIKGAAMAFLIMVQTLSPSLNSSERAAILDKFSASSKPSISEEIGNIRYSQTILENGKLLMLSADVKTEK